MNNPPPHIVSTMSRVLRDALAPAAALHECLFVLQALACSGLIQLHLTGGRKFIGMLIECRFYPGGDHGDVTGSVALIGPDADYPRCFNIMEIIGAQCLETPKLRLEEKGK